MKVIDKTPLQDGKGNISLLRRVRAAMEYGFAWQAEIEAQKPVIAELERVLERGYTLIRNLNLENSKIIEPLILIGPSGVFVLHVTSATGFFEANGDDWIVIRNDRRTPASVNPIIWVARMSRALQVYLNRQGVTLPCVVEPVLIAGNPAVHIDVLNPVIRVVLSDAVKQWCASLLQAPAVLRTEVVSDVVDRLLNPRPKSTPPVAPPHTESPDTVRATNDPASRARAIFRAAEEAKPLDPADLKYEFGEQASNEVPDPLIGKSTSRQPAVAPRRASLSPVQWILLVVLVLVELGVLAAFLYLILFGSA